MDRLVAKTEHGDCMLAIAKAAHLTREILDVDARAAVDMRRVLVRQDRDAHRPPPSLNAWVCPGYVSRSTAKREPLFAGPLHSFAMGGRPFGVRRFIAAFCRRP